MVITSYNSLSLTSSWYHFERNWSQYWLHLCLHTSGHFWSFLLRLFRAIAELLIPISLCDSLYLSCYKNWSCFLSSKNFENISTCPHMHQDLFGFYFSLRKLAPMCYFLHKSSPTTKTIQFWYSLMFVHSFIVPCWLTWWLFPPAEHDTYTNR